MMNKGEPSGTGRYYNRSNIGKHLQTEVVPENTYVCRPGPRERSAMVALGEIPSKLQNIVTLCSTFSAKNYSPRTPKSLLKLKYDLRMLCEHLLDLKKHWQDNYYYHLIAKQQNTFRKDPIRIFKQAIERSDFDIQDFNMEFDLYLDILKKLTTIKQFRANDPEKIKKNVWFANPDNDESRKTITFKDLQENNDFYKKAEDEYAQALNFGMRAFYKRTYDDSTKKSLNAHCEFIHKFELPENYNEIDLKENCSDLLMALAAVGELFEQISRDKNNGDITINGQVVNSLNFKDFISVRNSVYSFDRRLEVDHVRNAIACVHACYKDLSITEERNNTLRA